MKNKFLVLMILLLTTGCTCEYSLTINGNDYKENIVLIGESSNEISSFNNKWVIPVDKDEYKMLSESDSECSDYNRIYNYDLSNNKLKFNYDFSKSNFNMSTAVSSCYDRITVDDYNLSTIISTSIKNNCFDKYPPLSSIKVSIVVDRDVISSNADVIDGKTYIWNITKNNANNKVINLVLNNNSQLDSNDIDNSIDNNINKDNSKINSFLDNYGLYILLVIIVIIIYFGYNWFMEFKERNNKID